MIPKTMPPKIEHLAAAALHATTKARCPKLDEPVPITVHVIIQET